MEEFKLEIEKYIQRKIDTEWKEFSSYLVVNTATKREIIFRQTDICDEVIYILEGIAASEYNSQGKYIINRFFQYGNLCSNMISAVSSSIQNDNVIALTKMKYITIPYKYFLNSYLHSNEIGIFLRKKILEHLVDAKTLISIKTSADTEIQYAFLEKNYSEIIRNIPSKYIAAFIGITPEALSRFLNKRYSS